MTNKFNFTQALAFMLAGAAVTRSAFKDCFIFRQVPSAIAPEIVERMTSLPQSVKDILLERGEGPSYYDQLAIVLPDSGVKGYSPSVEDVFAEDWMLYERPLIVHHTITGIVQPAQVRKYIKDGTLLMHVIGYTLSEDDTVNNEDLVENQIDNGLFMEDIEYVQLQSKSGLEVVEVLIRDTEQWETSYDEANLPPG